MIDYRLKAEVLKTDLCKRLKRHDKKHYDNSINGVVRDKKLDAEYWNMLQEYDYKYIQEARKINNATYRRTKRLYDRVANYLQYPCVFLTLTFKDDVLNETNEKTRRKYVSRLLKRISKHYVANIDYGESDRFSHREHYHAICVGNIQKKDLSSWSDSIGYTWIESINRGSSDIKIAKYISKLTNHAIKSSTRRHVYIYSRDN